MKNYKIYSLDAVSRTALAQDLTCVDDLDALGWAEKIASHGAGTEVWQGSRLVARVKAGNAPLETADRHSL
jgi:hypothetical protein